MERLNLNVPEGTRAALRRLAQLAKMREGELARELLVQAVRRAEREEFCRAMQSGMTATARKRLHAIAVAQEKLRGGTR